MRILSFKEDNTKLLAFINSNIEQSTFILSNLSVDNKVIRGLVVNDKIVGIYLIANETFITYLLSDEISDSQCIELVNDASNYKHLSGSVVNPNFECFKDNYQFDIDEGETNEQAWCELASVKRNQIKPSISNCDYKITKLEYDQIDLYMEGLRDAKVFQGIKKKAVLRSYSKTATYVVWNQSQIIGGASLTTGNDKVGVVTAVFTNPEFERKQIATTVVSKLLVDYQNDKGIYIIFFNNPIAKELYLKLGFTVKDKLLLLKKK